MAEVILKNSTQLTVVKDPMVNISTKYPVYLALRDQKGFGECLQYRRIENSTLLYVTYYKNTCFDPFWSKTSKRIESNLTWKGFKTCQEALMDAHAISSGHLTGFSGEKSGTFFTIGCCCVHCIILWLTVMIVMIL